jgi:hypothetical protein
MERLQKENLREQRRDLMKKWRNKLEGDKNVSLYSYWKKISENYAKDPDFLALEKIDRLQVFEDYLRDLGVRRDEVKK